MFEVTIYQKTNSRGIKNSPSGFTTEFTVKQGDTETLSQAVSFDNCPAKYHNGYRRGDNFIQADCILADIDNSHSDNPTEWITEEDVAKLLCNVAFYWYPSRNDMKEKDGKAPRPKRHFIFPIDTVTSAVEYTTLMKWLIDTFPNLYFDKAVKGAAQLNFGVENAKVYYIDGEINLSDFMKSYKTDSQHTDKEKPKKKKSEKKSHSNLIDIIPEGQRNNTMLRFANCTLKRYGENDGLSYQVFLKESEKCSPPLEEKELESIWDSALNFYYDVILPDKDYIPPQQFSAFQLQVTDKNSYADLLSVDKDYRRLNIATCKLFLKAYGITIQLNDMSTRKEITGLPSRFNLEDSENLLETLLADTVQLNSYKINRNLPIPNLLNVIANENHYHPVIKLLNEEPWDNTDRLTELYEIMGITNSFYKTLIEKWLIQTIAVLYNDVNNAFSPENVLVLQGEQGIGKTQLFRHLAIKNEFFLDGAVLDMRNKDTLMAATRVWICELGEIDSTTTKKQSALKGFLSKQIDSIRDVYARSPKHRVRRTSFCGTVNPKEYLTDETGNRRFWTIPITKIDLEKVFDKNPEWYTQLWRQIQVEYNRNPKGYLLTQEEQATVSLCNKEFETLVAGEDEFMTMFDTNCEISKWKNLYTAAQIADVINSKYTGVNVSSINVGKQLIPKINQRLGVEILTKKTNGSKFYYLPPLSDENAPKSLPPYIAPPKKMK